MNRYKADTVRAYAGMAIAMFGWSPRTRKSRRDWVRAALSLKAKRAQAIAQLGDKHILRGGSAHRWTPRCQGGQR